MNIGDNIEIRQGTLPIGTGKISDFPDIGQIKVQPDEPTGATITAPRDWCSWKPSGGYVLTLPGEGIV